MHNGITTNGGRTLNTMFKALTIAGSDSGGGAGIQADLKTFSALGVYGASAITALTAQNTKGVRAIHEAPPDFVAAQIDAVLEDIGADAAKTGMLSSAPIIRAVAARLRHYMLEKLVVDPVMVAKSGDVLLRAEAVDALKSEILPLALIVTPNIPEAEVLSGMTLADDQSIKEAARRIHSLGPRYVIIKGGHRTGAALDIVFDGQGFSELSTPRLSNPNTHGTGCTFSAAIAAYLARGFSVPDSIAKAKHYLTEAIRMGVSIGGGVSPVNHFHALWPGIQD